jgi:hypothetical protein
MEERREDYPQLLERLISIEKKVNGGLADQFKDLKETNRGIWEKHDAEAKEFRSNTTRMWERVESKVDKLAAVINDRPCVLHSEKIKNLDDTRNFQAVVMVACLVAFITGLIGYGSLRKQVDINTSRWEHLIDGDKVK